MTLPRVLGSNICFFKIIADVFLPEIPYERVLGDDGEEGRDSHLDKYQELAFQLKYRPQHVTIFIFCQTYSDQISHTASSERREETCC